MKNTFSYAWEYLVKKECVEEFEEIYGPEGEWVKLFRKAKGYIKTELYQDRNDSLRFITIDFWNSKEDRDKFRSEFSDEFKALDIAGDKLTDEEKNLGDFDLISSQSN